MAVVTAPVADYSGLVAGVNFVGGKGETDDGNAIAYFRRHGYSIADDKPKRAPRKAAEA